MNVCFKCGSVKAVFAACSEECVRGSLMVEQANRMHKPAPVAQRVMETEMYSINSMDVPHQNEAATMRWRA